MRAARDSSSGVGVKQLAHLSVDVLPIGEYLVDGGSGEQATRRARMSRTDCLVVGIEEVVEPRIVRRGSACRFAQNEALEEPGRVCKVPLDRARIGHALDHEVLGVEGRAQRDGLLAHGFVTNRVVGLRNPGAEIELGVHVVLRRYQGMKTALRQGSHQPCG